MEDQEYVIFEVEGRIYTALASASISLRKNERTNMPKIMKMKEMTWYNRQYMYIQRYNRLKTIQVVITICMIKRQ